MGGGSISQEREDAMKAKKVFFCIPSSIFSNLWKGEIRENSRCENR